MMNFDVSDVEQQGGAPIHVTGRFGPDGIELDTRLLFARRKEKRRAQPMPLNTASGRGGN
jgi:hypothetical protein